MVFAEKAFWIATGERAAKTFCQALVALFVAGVTILNLDWVQAVGVAGTAALVSVLTSIASAKVGSWEGPSLVSEGLVVPAVELELEDQLS